MMKTFISILIVVCLTTTVDMAPLETSSNKRMEVAIEKRATTTSTSTPSPSTSSTTITESSSMRAKRLRESG